MAVETRVSAEASYYDTVHRHGLSVSVPIFFMEESQETCQRDVGCLTEAAIEMRGISGQLQRGRCWDSGRGLRVMDARLERMHILGLLFVHESRHLPEPLQQLVVFARGLRRSLAGLFWCYPPRLVDLRGL